MSINTASGAKFFICTTPTVATEQSEYEALTWVEVKEVSNFGEYGDESNSVTFSAVGDARVRKLKGARDAGTLALVCGRDPLDAGQNAMKTAQKTKFQYPFKVLHADAPSELYANTVQYFQGLVMSQRDNVGENDNVVTTTFNVGINSEILEIPAALL